MHIQNVSQCFFLRPAVPLIHLLNDNSSPFLPRQCLSIEILTHLSFCDALPNLSPKIYAIYAVPDHRIRRSQILLIGSDSPSLNT